MLLTGALVWLALGSLWVWPAILLYGTVLTVPAYALSHETAHGTAFRTPWLNETVFWVSSLIYGGEPLHRRYTHTNHPQMPFSSLPALGASLSPQLPAPDPGFWRTNAEVLLVVARRSLGRLTKAPSIRQAPLMTTTGAFSRIAKSSM